MLRRFDDWRGIALGAADGDLGTIQDVYFDDESWTIRYLVADTSLWLGRVSLISTIAAGPVDWQARRLPVFSSRKEIGNSPDILSRGRLTREQEAEFLSYYGYPFYWYGPDLWAWADTPAALQSAPPPGYAPVIGDAPDAATTSIFSASEISGSHIQATDDEIGHVDDYIVEDETWAIRYLQIDTSNWIGGRTVMLGTRWVTRIDPGDGKLHVDLTKQKIETAPEYDPAQPIDRHYEERLHRHYDLASYWEQPRPQVRGAGR